MGRGGRGWRGREKPMSRPSSKNKQNPAQSPLPPPSHPLPPRQHGSPAPGDHHPRLIYRKYCVFTYNYPSILLQSEPNESPILPPGCIHTVGNVRDGVQLVHKAADSLRLGMTRDRRRDWVGGRDSRGRELRQTVPESIPRLVVQLPENGLNRHHLVPDRGSLVIIGLLLADDGRRSS